MFDVMRRRARCGARVRAYSIAHASSSCRVSGTQRRRSNPCLVFGLMFVSSDRPTLGVGRRSQLARTALAVPVGKAEAACRGLPDGSVAITRREAVDDVLEPPDLRDER